GITSRYSKQTARKNHKVYLEFLPKEEKNDEYVEDKNEIDQNTFQLNIPENINSYCTCKSGARTVGACAHIIACLYWIYLKINNITMEEEEKKTTNIKNSITDLKTFKNAKKKKKKKN